MRTATIPRLLFGTLLCSRLTCCAAGENPSINAAALVCSATNRGLYICLDTWENATTARNEGTLGFNDLILFKVLSAEGRDVPIAYPSKFEYLCNVELLDSRGTNVSKTSLG